MTCGQERCEEEASHGFEWPGHKPIAVCILCFLKAERIARFMGFRLAEVSIREIEAGLAHETVRMLKGADL